MLNSWTIFKAFSRTRKEKAAAGFERGHSVSSNAFTTKGTTTTQAEFELRSFGPAVQNLTNSVAVTFTAGLEPVPLDSKSKTLPPEPPPLNFLLKNLISKQKPGQGRENQRRQKVDPEHPIKSGEEDFFGFSAARPSPSSSLCSVNFFRSELNFDLFSWR